MEYRNTPEFIAAVEVIEVAQVQEEVQSFDQEGEEEGDVENE